MAEWANLFDIGDCIVTAKANGAVDFSQTMAKGSTASWGDRTIAVSSSGSVSIDGDFVVSGSMSLSVRLATSVARTGERMTGVAFGGGVFGASASVSAAGPSIAFDTITPASPDPMVVTGIAGSHDDMAITAIPTPS